ncbi:restriction endonuclease subunit S [Sorangium sp. So ce1335]|uniref:restriction endonuclease subunit S n=1 Tax=Sorangium sp. So ce1335 TaxID=3133335 RepID=UPI003F603723
MHGYAFSGMMESEDESIPIVVNIGNFKYDGGFRFESTKIQRYAGEYPERFRLAPGDVLLVMTCQTAGGEILGIPGRIPDDGRLYLHNQRLGKVVITKPNELDLEYLYYLFLSPQFNAHLVATASGAKILHTAPSRIGSFTWLRPPLSVQRRITDILSAYDELIENNTKRNRLLQKQTDLVFAQVEAEVARCTEQMKLGEIADSSGGTIRTGPFGSQLHESDYTPEGTPVVMPKNLIDGRIDTAEIARIPDNLVQKLAQHKLLEGDIVYGRRGDIGRRAFIRRRQAGWLCGTGCLRISLRQGPLQSRYLHQYLGKTEVVALIASRAVGATMPNLNTSILRDVLVAVPPLEYQQKFTQFAHANDELMHDLIAQNEVLRATRDFLLPRLISGEIDVSRLEAPDA